MQNNQTLADYWSNNPTHYYLRQSIVLVAEIGFLACCCVFFALESGKSCYVTSPAGDVSEVSHEYYKAYILLIICHFYLILKVLYFTWTLKKKEDQGTIKCCLQCWCCYTTGVSIFVQVVYFTYGIDKCKDQLPLLSTWLMAEVIIFYCYIFMECITGLSIFLVMLRRHTKRYSPSADEDDIETQ